MKITHVPFLVVVCSKCRINTRAVVYGFKACEPRMDGALSHGLCPRCYVVELGKLKGAR